LKYNNKVYIDEFRLYSSIYTKKDVVATNYKFKYMLLNNP